MARITHLEDRLRADEGGGARRRALDRLAEAEARLKQQLRQPNDSATYQALTLQLDACYAATHVVTRLWQRYHGY